MHMSYGPSMLANTPHVEARHTIAVAVLLSHHDHEDQVSDVDHTLPHLVHNHARLTQTGQRVHQHSHKLQFQQHNCIM